MPSIAPSGELRRLKRVKTASYARGMSSPRAIRAVLACLAAVLLGSCAGTRGAPQAAHAASYPAARFAVFSDPHLFDQSLGTDDNDRKLLRESGEILSVAIQRVESLAVSFLLIPGDLTKDGELQDHLLMARQLAGLARAGSKCTWCRAITMSSIRTPLPSVHRERSGY